MNRSLANVIFGAVGGEDGGAASDGEGKQLNIKSYSTEEAAMIFDAAEKIIIVPGYGLAVAQAQHAVRELGELSNVDAVIVTDMRTSQHTFEKVALIVPENKIFVPELLHVNRKTMGFRKNGANK